MENYITLEDLKDFEVWKSWRNGGGLELEPLYSEEDMKKCWVQAQESKFDEMLGASTRK
jgi:hypothetical protein